MAIKVNVVLSPAQADALLKVLATAPKQTKTIEALMAKVQAAIGVAA
jgi:hypothetical protein